MLVISRQIKESIFLGAASGSSLVTVLEIILETEQVKILVTQSAIARPAELNCGSVELRVGERIRVGATEVSIEKVIDKKVRLGIVAPADVNVQRLEVWEKIRGDGGMGWERI